MVLHTRRNLEWCIIWKSCILRNAKRSSGTLHMSQRAKQPHDICIAGSTTDQSLPPSYHKLSSDVIKNLSGEKPFSRSASRSAAGSKGNPLGSMDKRPSLQGSKGTLSSSKGQGSPLQRGDGQQKTTAPLSASKTSSAGAAVTSKGSVEEKGKSHTAAAAAVGGSLQQSGLSPRKRQTTFSFEDVKDHIPEAAPVSNKGLVSEATLTQSILQQMSYTGSHEARGHLFLEVCFGLLHYICHDLTPYICHNLTPCQGHSVSSSMHAGQPPQHISNHCCH